MSTYTEHFYEPYFGLSIRPPVLGWYRLIIFDEQSVADLHPSYLNDSLSELLSAVVSIATDTPTCQSATASFANEPGSYGLYMSRTGDKVRLEITFTEDNDCGLSSGEVAEALTKEGCLRSFEVGYRWLAWATLREFKAIKSILGLDRYRKEWHFDFPAKDFEVLALQVAKWAQDRIDVFS